LGFLEIPGSGDEHGLRQAVFTRGVHMYDVHWAVANTPVFAGALPFDELLARSVALPAISEHARGLSHVDALLLACIHRVAHHHDSERLIWLCDIALLRDRMSEEEHRAFWRLAVERRIVGICVRSVELAGDWMSRPNRYPPEDYLTPVEVARDEPSRTFMNRRITRGRVLAANLRALPWRSRAWRLWQLAFPPRRFMERSFGTRSRLALPWLYVYRGARGLARLFRRV
ncbi:MAG TPA: nucleotidyltransferase family protein, partial [Thermoanaerobaculia bacterium]|nr:nucleotidyltransferase family protein [Thermoanaerobaculia bacterium]